MSEREDIDSKREPGRVVPFERLADLLAPYLSGISYAPMADEVNPLELFPAAAPKVQYTIKADNSVVPADEVTKTRGIIGDASVFVFVPGQKFDTLGTRHGRGGGWYDRFLKAVPHDWLRVGFCYHEQFSTTPLERQAWDEPVDFLCVVNHLTKDVTCYETHARS